MNDNIPYFTKDDLTTEAFETYSELDDLGRCGVAYANVCQELMPTEDRGEIGQVKPTGWHTVKYDFISGKYLYNRCHLLGYQLTAENANEQNLITGTRYLNVEGMLRSRTWSPTMWRKQITMCLPCDSYLPGRRTGGPGRPHGGPIG